MSASSSTGGSSFSSSWDLVSRPRVPRVASRPRHSPTCRCSQCYLRPCLYPRGDTGQILLPLPGSWLEAQGTVNASMESPANVNGDPSGKGKGREIVSPIPSWSHDVRRLEGQLDVQGQPRSPSWHQNKQVGEHSRTKARKNPQRASTALHSDSSTYGGRVSHESHLQGLTLAGPSSHPPRPSGNDPMTTDSTVTTRPSQPLAERREPIFLTPAMSSLPQPGPSSRTGSKRKLSDRDDTFDPPEHVLDFRNPPPPQGREPLRGFPKQRINSRGDSGGLTSGYSRQGTPESHFQSYRSHVPERESPRGQFVTETASMETGPSSSRPRSMSEVGMWSTDAGPSRRRGSPSSEGHQPRRSPPGEVSSSNFGIQSSVARFNARARKTAPSASAPITPKESDDEGQASGSQAGSSQTTIRFREPLTADSRQDRRVIKGGVATIQVKWDSDRKRRQGYFAPDAGPEKSKFRHYSKDDCCFDG